MIIENFENNLKNESLLKTGGQIRHSKNQVKDRVKSSTNTRETLNYATYTWNLKHGKIYLNQSQKNLIEQSFRGQMIELKYI